MRLRLWAPAGFAGLLKRHAEFEKQLVDVALAANISVDEVRAAATTLGNKLDAERLKVLRRRALMTGRIDDV